MSLSAEQSEFLSVLLATQDPSTVRSAEERLDLYATSFGSYARLLLSMLQPPASAAVPPHLHQFVAILLKRYIGKHWSESADGFEAPVVPEGDKVLLRGSLLPLLASPHKGVRKQLAAAIAVVAEWDFPERWDSLLPDILGVLARAQSGMQAEQLSAHLLTGAMEVLVSFCEEMTDAQMTHAVPHLFPALLALCHSKWAAIAQAQAAAAQHPSGSAAEEQLPEPAAAALADAVQFCVYALQVYQSCCSSLLSINEVVNDQVRTSARSSGAKGKKGSSSSSAAAAPVRDQILIQYLQPTLQAWLSFLASILTLPPAASPLQRLNLSAACPLLWSLRLEATKTALCIVEKFDEHLLALGAPGAQILAGMVELTLEVSVGVWPLYQRKVLNAHIDSDDDAENSADAQGAAADGDESSEEEEAFDEDGNAISMSAFLFEGFMLLKALLQMRAPRKSAAASKSVGGKKGKNNSSASSAAAAAQDPKQQSWSLLKSLFRSPALLQRLLEVCMQYIQLSSGEIQASLGHIDDFLAFQHVDADGEGGSVNVQKVNVRNGAKELLLDCMLFSEDGHDDEAGGMSAAEKEEAAQLALMGFSMRDASSSDAPASGSSSSELLDRSQVIRTLAPLLSSLLVQSSSLRSSPTNTPGRKNWWKPREAATMILGYIVSDISEMNTPPAPAAAAGKKKGAAVAQKQHEPVQFDLQSFIRDVLIPDLSPQQPPSSSSALPPAHVLLRTQALHSTRHFAPVFEKVHETGLVSLALEALVANMSAPATPGKDDDLLVRISAIHAFGELCATLQEKSLLLQGDTLVRALRSICQLVHSASVGGVTGATAAAASKPQANKKEVDESALLKVLETLLMAIAVDTNTSILAEPTLTPLLLAAWSANATAPSISDSIVDILENLLALSPGSCTSVQVAIIPALTSILQAERNGVAVTGTVQAALDLLKHVLLSVEKHTRAATAAASTTGAAAAPTSPTSPSRGPSAAPELLHPLLFSDLLPLTLALLLHTDDHSLVEVGTTVLTAFLRVDAARVSSATVVPVTGAAAAAGSTTAAISLPAGPLTGLASLCILVRQWLDPSLDDRVAHNVGNLVVQMVFSLGATLGEANVQELLKAVVARLFSSSYPPLTESLLLVFARLIHSSVDGAGSLVRFLSGMGPLALQEKKTVRVKKNPHDKYASMLQTQLFPVTVDPLSFLITKWTESQKEVHAAYPCKVLFTALTKLLGFLYSSDAPTEAARAALRNSECKGYPVVAKGGAGPAKRVTRSAAASSGQGHEPAYTRIPLSAKLLHLLLTEWDEWAKRDAKRARRDAKRLGRAAGTLHEDDEDGSDSDEDFDSEDFDDDDDDDESDDADEDDFVARIIAQEKAQKGRGGGGGAASSASPFAAAEDHPTLGAGGGRGSGGGGGNKQFIQLSDLLDSADAEELDAELEDDVYPESLTDPLNQIELGPFLRDFLREFAACAQGAALRDAAAHLSPADQKTLQRALESPAPKPAGATATPAKKR